MDMQTLYHEMKNALDYLGLSFHEMHKVQVIFTDKEIEFHYEGRKCCLDFLAGTL